jgi:hypothetical protein
MAGALTQRLGLFAAALPPDYALTFYDAGPYTTSSGGTQDVCTFLVTAAQLSASAQYLVFWSAQATNNNTSSGSHSLRVNGSAVSTAQLITIQTTSPQDQSVLGGVYLFAPGGSPVDTTFVIRVAAAASAVATGRNSRITLLKLGANDAATENNSSVGGSGSSPTNVVTHNWTPGTVGDYVVIGWCDASGNNTSGPRVRMSYASVDTEILWRAPSGDKCSHMFLQYASAVAASAQSATIGVYRASLGATTTSVRCGIATIRADRFNAAFHDRLGASSTGTETSYTAGQTMTYTPAAAVQLTLVMSGTSGDSTSESAYLKVVDDATDRVENIRQPGTANGQNMVVFHDVRTYTAVSRTWTVQRKTETSANASVLTPSTIIGFDLTGVAVP